MNKLIARIFKTQTLPQLEKLLQSYDPDKIRSNLLDEYDRLFKYKNLKEWNALVGICEALAIVGWGRREPVEAYAETWLNGSWYTYLNTRYFEALEGHGDGPRGGSARGWSKKGNSYVIHEGSDPKNYDIKKFAIQRNPLPKNPIRLTRGIANHQKSAGRFVKALEHLRTRFNRELRPELYGSDFGYLVVWLSFSYHDDEHWSVRSVYFHSKQDVPKGYKGRYYIRPRVEFGRLAVKEGQLKLEVRRHFTRAEGELPLGKQKRLFKSDLAEILDTLEQKLVAKRIKFDVKTLREDVQSVLATW